MQPGIIIETQRLLLKEFTHEDSEFIFELLNSPGWLKNIGNRSIKTNADAINYIYSRLRKSYAESGFGFYLMVDKTSGAKLGMCGLVKREGLDDIDIGFALLPQYEGKGYAFEASESVMKFAKDNLNISKIAAITVPGNTSSIRLLEKLGLKFEKTISLPGDPETLMLFSKEFNN